MVDTLALAETHRIQQVRGATAIQQALGIAFKRTLSPADLDASFPTYLRSALTILTVGRRQAAGTAQAYYGNAREAAGLSKIVPAIRVPPLDVKAAATSLLVTGPVSVKKQLSNGVALQAAVDSAMRQTMAYGKRATLSGGREALIAVTNADSDANGWARVSDGQPCAFCAMLVSRGPVYSQDGVDFKAHDGCGCGVRPWFEGDPDGGWSPDARALNDLYQANKADGLTGFRSAYREAVADPENPVFQAFTTKVGAQIAKPVTAAAKGAAEAAFQAARAAQRAAEVEASSAATKIAQEAAQAEAKAAAAEAAKIKKWAGKPAPKKPLAPAPPGTVGEVAFDPWVQAVKDRFAAFAKSTGNPKNDLTKSNNWATVQRVVKDHDLSALDSLRQMNYIDDALHADAKAAIKKALEPVPGAAEAYKSGLRSYRNLSTRYDRYIAEWREVNGVDAAALRGMDDALRHATNDDGVRWANGSLKVADGTERSAIVEYTGSSYAPWNGALRAHADVSSAPAAWASKTKRADGAFAPIPEDVILNRGTTWQEFDLGDGKRSYSIPPPPPEDLIGTVHTQHGYMSTSVGQNSAFSSNPVQMKIRVPEGHGATWAMPYSRFSHERELMLQRGTNFFIHDIYRDPRTGNYVVEAEVLPMDVDPSTFVGAAPSPASTKFR